MAWTWVSRECVGGLLRWRKVLPEEVKPDGQSSERLESQRRRRQEKHSKEPEWAQHGRVSWRKSRGGKKPVSIHLHVNRHSISRKGCVWCACSCEGYKCMCNCAYVCVQVHNRGYRSTSVIPQEPLALCFWDGVSQQPEIHWLGWVYWSANPRDPPVFVSPTLGL